MTEEKKAAAPQTEKVATPPEEKKEVAPASRETAVVVPVPVPDHEIAVDDTLKEIASLIRGVLKHNRIDTPNETKVYIMEAKDSLAQIAKEIENAVNGSSSHLGMVRGLVSRVMIQPIYAEMDRLQAKINKRELA